MRYLYKGSSYFDDLYTPYGRLIVSLRKTTTSPTHSRKAMLLKKVRRRPRRVTQIKIFPNRQRILFENINNSPLY